MASWNDNAWESIAKDYPDLEGKSESVAFIAWTLKNNPDISPADLRAAGEEAGIPVAGRAIGSAREILGITKPKPKKGRKKKGGQGAKGSRRSTGSSEGLVGVTAALDAVRGLERQNQVMRAALERSRDAIDRVIA